MGDSFCEEYGDKGDTGLSLLKADRGPMKGCGGIGIAMPDSFLGVAPSSSRAALRSCPGKTLGAVTGVSPV